MISLIDQAWENAYKRQGQLDPDGYLPTYLMPVAPVVGSLIAGTICAFIVGAYLLSQTPNIDSRDLVPPVAVTAAVITAVGIFFAARRGSVVFRRLWTNRKQ